MLAGRSLLEGTAIEGVEAPYPVAVWWVWKQQGILPAENLYKLPAKLAQTVLLLDQELTAHQQEIYESAKLR